MEASVSSLIYLPKSFLEHPLPLTAPGRAGFSTFRSVDGATSHSLQIGLLDRWGRTPPLPCGGLTLENVSVLLALLSLCPPSSPALPISYNRLFQTLTPTSRSCSSHHRESLKNTLASLCALDLTDLSAPTAHFEPLLSLTPTHSRPIFGRTTPAFLPSYSPLFTHLLCDTQASAPVRTDILFSLRSRYARVLYLFLPTWAFYHRSFSQKAPFRITLARLIEHLGIPVPRYRAERLALFGGHRKTSVFSALNGVPTAFGTLHLSLSPATSVDDDCLCVHLEGAPANLSRGNSSSRKGNPTPSDPLAPFRSLKIYEAWNHSGRPSGDFIDRVRTPSRLSPHDHELLLAAKVSLQKSERFLTMAKKLISERTWLDLLGEAKYALHSPAPPLNPTAKLIGELLSAIRSKL